MEAEKLVKAGEVAETPDRKTALVNDEGEAYLVQEPTIVVWDSFDGKTVGEVARRLADASGESLEELVGPVHELAQELQRVGLLVPM